MSDIQNTYAMKQGEIDKKWLLIDAEGKVLGRLATEVALILRGKHKPSFSPYLDMGDNVIIINADKIVLTGAKELDKDYFFHSQYPGGEKFVNIKKIMAKKPEFILTHAVKGMLPKNKLSRAIMNNLKVYAGTEHPHEAQKPEKINV